MLKLIVFLLLLHATLTAVNVRYDGIKPSGSSFNGLSSQGSYGGQPVSLESNNGNETDFKYGYGTRVYKPIYPVPSTAGSFGGFPSSSSPLTPNSISHPYATQLPKEGI